MSKGLDVKTIVDINQTANRFKSSIVMRMSNKNIDVKSILGLSLSLLSSDKFILEIHGPDEELAGSTMIEVFQKHGLSVEII